MRDAIAVIIEIIKKEFYQIRQDKRMTIVSVFVPVLNPERSEGSHCTNHAQRCFASLNIGWHYA